MASTIASTLRSMRRCGRGDAVDLADFATICKAAEPCGLTLEHASLISNEAHMTTFDKREEGFEKKFAHRRGAEVQGDGPAQQAARPVGGGKARALRRRRRSLRQRGRDGRFRGGRRRRRVPQDPQGFRRQGRRRNPTSRSAAPWTSCWRRRSRRSKAARDGNASMAADRFSLARRLARRRDRPHRLVRAAAFRSSPN